jgi:long-chain acyl-CoA synthetase
VLQMIWENVRDTNRDLAADPMLSHCQISRFLVLHKELDADDGELTRTRKVRRRFISEKYDDLVDALYGGAEEVATETEVTYEDGRKGTIRATLRIQDAETFPPAEAAGATDRAA